MTDCHRLIKLATQKMIVSILSNILTDQRGWIFSLAQVAPEEVEVTVGGILAALCVLAAFTGSLFVFATWRGRMSRGESVIPAADRPGIVIPVPILVFGLLIALFMSSMAISAGLERETENNNAATDVKPKPESDETDAIDSDTEPTVTAAPSNIPARSFEALEAALVQTVILDLFLIVFLGVPVWWLHHEGMLAAAETGHESDELAELTDEAKAYDLELSNPYSAPRQALELQPISVSASEPWDFGREFRYAAEVMLAAWLPTAVLRLITVLVSQDESQHPFLELISNGVSTQVLLLIAGTAVCLAPLMEELLYRVVILGGLLFRGSTTTGWPSVLAVGVSSVLFSLAHGFPDSLALLPLAVIIGWTYHQRRSYRTVVLIHFLFNGFNIVIAALGML